MRSIALSRRQRTTFPSTGQVSEIARVRAHGLDDERPSRLPQVLSNLHGNRWPDCLTVKGALKSFFGSFIRAPFGNVRPHHIVEQFADAHNAVQRPHWHSLGPRGLFPLHFLDYGWGGARNAPRSRGSGFASPITWFCDDGVDFPRTPTFCPSSLRSPSAHSLLYDAASFASSAAVNFTSAKELGHIVPSSRFALSLKPRVESRALNLEAGWKKQTTLPSWSRPAFRTRFSGPDLVPPPSRWRGRVLPLRGRAVASRRSSRAPPARRRPRSGSCRGETQPSALEGIPS